MDADGGAMPTAEGKPSARRYADGLSNAGGISWYTDETYADGAMATATVGTQLRRRHLELCLRLLAVGV
jgi:hypothetical protein